MYLALEQRAREPWLIVHLNIAVYSLEGISYYLHKEGAAMAGDLADEAFEQWLEQSLGLESLATELREKRLLGISLAERMTFLLASTPYGRSLDHAAFTNRLEAGAGRSQEEHYRCLGDNAFRRGNYPLAVSNYRQSLASGFTKEAANNLALTYLALDDFDRAATLLDGCIVKGDDLEVRLNRIRLKHLIGDYEAMLRDLAHLGGLYSDQRIWLSYGLAYEGLERKEEALAAYGRSAEAGNEAGLKAFVRMALEEDGGVLNLWLKDHPLPEIMKLYVIAQECLHEGDQDGYIAGMEMIYDLREGDRAIGFELVEYYMGVGQIIKALEYLNNIASRAETDDEEIRCYRAQLASAAGNRKLFVNETESLMYQWKGEARQQASR